VETDQMEANLVLLKKGGVHKVIPLPGNVTVVGRRHGCDLRIPLPTVSRKHCEISQNGEALKIRDLKSTWGTFVNNKKVNGDTPVKAGDYLRIGPLTFVCQIDGLPEQIVPPKAPSPPPQAKAPPATPSVPDDLAAGLEDSFTDLDASDSVVALDDSDSDLDDIENL
jgi:predicted component of type VI protein secretion system